MKATRKEDTNVQIAHHGFAAKDAKGRVVGAAVCTFEADMVEYEGGCYWNLPVGHYFGFQPQATRDGKDFGPIQRIQFFTSAAERDVVIAKYLKSAKARAEKKA